MDGVFMKKIIRCCLAIVLVAFMFWLGNVVAAPSMIFDLLDSIKDAGTNFTDILKNVVQQIKLFFF